MSLPVLPVSGVSGSADEIFFSEHGYAAFKTSDTYATTIPGWVTKADEALQRYLEKATAAGGLGIGKEKGFRELVMKDPCRYDVNFDNAVGNDPISANFMHEIQSAISQSAGPLLQKVLGVDYKWNAQGMVTSLPGAKAQGWHVDSSHLFVGPAELLGKLPCHFVTVFIPLFKSSLPIGPTEMVPGTHLLTSEMPNATIPDQYPSLETVERLTNVASAKRDGYRSCFLDFSPGDIIVMDGRMLHRGLDNNLARRHLIYISFCRPWYYEWPRSHSDHASLFKNSKL